MSLLSGRAGVPYKVRCTPREESAQTRRRGYCTNDIEALETSGILMQDGAGTKPELETGTVRPIFFQEPTELQHLKL